MQIYAGKSIVLNTRAAALGSVAAIAFGALIASSPSIMAQQADPGANPTAAQDGSQQEGIQQVQQETQPGQPMGQIYVAEQREGEIAVADSYIGEAVLNRSDETVGDINDLILNENGQVSAAIIGVGGFLGMGEKNVAVRFDAIEMQKSPDTDKIRLVIDATQEQLAEAPAYVTIAMKRVDEQMAAQQALDEQTGSIGTTTLPSSKPAN